MPILHDLLVPARVYLPVTLNRSAINCSAFASTDTPQTIPDNLLTGVDSTLIVPGPGMTIADVTLVIDQLDHNYVGDLQITLVAPDGTAVLVIDRVGGGGRDFFRTRLNDAFSTPIASGKAPFLGDFKPDNPMSAFRNLNSAGTWKLHLVDRAVGDEGRLVAWSLQVCGDSP